MADVNETNPYESGTEVAGEPGVTSEFRPGLWLLALGAGVAGGLLVSIPPMQLTRNPEYLLGFPFATGAIFCLVASRLRAWWGFAGGAVLGAILGFPVGDMFNFTRGPSLPVQICAACMLGCCLACLGALVATFMAKKGWVGIAAIFLVILTGAMTLLMLLASGGVGPAPPDLIDTRPPPATTPPPPLPPARE